MGESFELESVDWITAGAVGAPGKRAFYVQARQGEVVVAVLVEKAQVRLLAELAQELLARAGVTVTPDDLDEVGQRLLEPVEPLWRAGSMSIGMDPEGQRFLLEAEELSGEGEDAAAGRFWMSRDQLVGMAAYAAYAVEAGGRETCRLCGRPRDPVTDHVCPSTNGHGPLTA